MKLTQIRRLTLVPLVLTMSDHARKPERLSLKPWIRSRKPVARNRKKENVSTLILMDEPEKIGTAEKRAPRPHGAGLVHLSVAV